MNKNASVTMAVAGILTLAVMTMNLQHQAFAGNYNQCCEKQQPQPCCGQQQPQCCEKQQPQPSKEQQQQSNEVAIGGNGGSGGAGGAGGEGGAGGKNIDTAYVSSNSASSSGNVTQKANGGDANGGHGGNANGGDAKV